MIPAAPPLVMATARLLPTLEDRSPGPRQGGVSADVVRIRARVDDVANRFVGETTNRREHRVGACRGSRIHEMTPSLPICTATLPPPPAIMNRFGRT
jgi:hypothetical protein